MSETYEVQLGDTFASIARVVYGRDDYADLIRSANPGATEPLIAFTILTIPPNPDTFFAETPGVVQTKGETPSVVIDGVVFDKWTEFTLTRCIDRMDTIELSAPFDPSDQQQVKILQPFTFKRLTVWSGVEFVLEGFVFNVLPKLNESSRTVEISGYSRPGVLNDCMPSSGEYPVSWVNADLFTIAYQLCKPFTIPIVADDDVGPVWDEQSCNPGTSILSFLAKLAKERKVVIGNDELGKLTLRQSVKPGNPVTRLVESKPPLTRVMADFKPDSYFSHVTVLPTYSLGYGDDGPVTRENKHLKTVFRPYVFKAGDSVEASLPDIADAKIGRMFGEAISYRIEVNTWRDKNGDIWKPNTTITLNAPSVMVYNDYEFVIRRVTLKRTADSETATLDLSLPGLFNGEQPDSLPWDNPEQGVA